MDFKNIIGHEEIISRFMSSIETDRVSHAYIIAGEEGSGRYTLAEAFAKTLQCEEGGSEACGQCKSCKQAESNNHPDIITVSHDKATVLSVDCIRTEVIDTMGIKPYSSKYKIYIIRDGEMMTEEAGGMHFLPPMKSFIELRSIRKEQWSSLLRTIEKVTEYEYLIMDLTEHTDGLLDLLRTCDRVYTIVRDDTFSRARYCQYEDLLRRMNYEDIKMRTQCWKLPVFREIPAGLEDLTRGELAVYIREMLLQGEYGQQYSVRESGWDTR